MKLSELIKTKDRSKKRVGRGVGCGKGKTSGRGTKGQKARGRVALGFIGGTLPLYKKLPYRRGLGNPKRTPKPLIVSLSKLNLLKKNETVDLESLISVGIINKKDSLRKNGIKIIGLGDITIPLIVKLPISASAALKIEKAGGKIIGE